MNATTSVTSRHPSRGATGAINHPTASRRDRAPSVVLADDDPDWAASLSELLREAGYRVEIASDGEQALDLIERSAPAVVVLDLHMPRLDGLSLLRELRRSAFDRPVLLVSAEDRAGFIADAMTAGAAAYLRKPAPPALVLRSVRRLVESFDGRLSTC
jgi:DNA-binding response OmpR family regulator